MSANDLPMSLSSWRAWIEIIVSCWRSHSRMSSLSSWRAWIEIMTLIQMSTVGTVALLMESVD